ncbi:MAG TPA: hypothetical protein PKH07_04500 [bacterium]|nr:hypothetical protein [bacterium]
MRERIVKLGTIDLDLVETTPIVFKGKLYRFEYVRPGYSGNADGVSFFRFVERDSGKASASFARDYHLGNVMVEGDTLYVTGTNKWDGDRVDLFVSDDMENWQSQVALELPGYGLFNTSLCRADEKYVLMFEVGRPPEVAGVRFTALFAVSDDLKKWNVLPQECCYAKDRYTAPHCLRFLDGYFYNFYLEAVSGGYEQYVVRSRDLIQWESSPLNPVLRACDNDRIIANPSLTAEQKERIRTAVNINNSDIDFCEYNGTLVINYSWGNQHGVEHLAEARFDGTLKEFLTGWFPEV